MVACFFINLAQAPIRIDGLKFLILQRLERTVPGAKASLGHLDLVWFHDTNALGLRFEEMRLQDGQGRVIASAGEMEAALAIDSLLGLHLAPARLTAADFFVALSVSANGRYELGYDAKGDPTAFAIDKAFRDLTGPEKLGRPISFTRQFSLKDGTIAFRQVGTDLKWRAQVAHIDFSKRKTRIKTDIGVAIVSEGQTSYLTAHADAETDLKTASLNAQIRDLIPSKVFPSVGATRALSHFRAAVNGRGSLSYSAKNGLENAFADIAAGQGSYAFGKAEQGFDALSLKADYAPKIKTMQFKSFRLKSRFLDTDLFGKVRITPEDEATGQKMAVEFDFTGPRVTGQLADDFPAQTLTDVHFIGAYTPDDRRLDIKSGKGLLGGSSPLTTKGKVYTDEKGQLGADLTAQVKGVFTKEQVFAFWPEKMTPVTRSDLIRRIKGGVYSNADFVLKAPPGHLKSDALENEDLRLTFDFRDMALNFHDKLQDATGLHGNGLLLGSRFDLFLKGGQLVEVPITGGGVSVPSFKKADKTDTHIWLTALSGAAQLIEAIDPLTGGNLGKEGLTRERLSGEAETRLDIKFATFAPLTLKNLDLRFTGRIRNAGLKQAALGWNITEGDLTVTGDYLADHLEVRGPAKLGPYAGEIGYTTQFEPKMQYVDFTGSFNARQFGGSPTKRVALKGKMEIFNNVGKGEIESDIFNGTVNWDGTEERPTHVTLTGNTLSAGMKGQGLPIFARFKPEIPTVIRLIRAGDIWTGDLEAEGFSGDLGYIDSDHPRLVYKATITPERAQLLGMGALPYFNQARKLSVDIGLDAQSREARIRLDDIDSVLDWTDEGDKPPLRTLTTSLTPEQMYAMGLPRGWFTPTQTIPVSAKWEQDAQGIKGEVLLGTQPVAFDLPDTEGVDFTSGSPWMKIYGDLDEPFLKRLGYLNHSLDLKGQIGFTLSLFQTENRAPDAIAPGEISAAVLNLDATQTQLQLARSEWVKPVGEAATLALSFDDRGEAGGMNISRIHGEGARIAVEGRASMLKDGTFDYADFSRIYLKDFANLSLKFYELDHPSTRIVSVKGKQLDIRPWFNPPKPKTVTVNRGVVPVDGPEPPVAYREPQGLPQRPLRVLIDVAALRASDTGVFSDVELNVEWDGRNRIKGEGSALTGEGSLVTLDFDPEDDHTEFTFEADNMGDLVRTAIGDKRLTGGTAVVEGKYRDGQVDATLKGENIRVSQIPALGQVLTLASLQGLSDTLSGAGITFKDYEFPIRYRNKYLFVRNGWAKGEALRINVWGSSDFERQSLDYQGTIIPAYGVNAAFAGVPLVGDVITSKSGEGVLGLKYKLKGRFETPQAQIDPLSLVLPGFLRRLLDEDRVDPLPAIELSEKKKKD
ncbi:AsmA-like C-terminal region-containing protein [Asticcacaulis sp. BYS171W]|uniref:AsmA-like C-terminal region-containing protein n=1 Tax=Asticcacaulis aquaticus TaxID=2984212 RepID=A0ABT5HNR3_9CAUL|nr:AsmA-like C-terminal region-containing protein [Asticcacaulis aquaticus]MDC7681706.1 AsmA-like C-terminal region-containing protein [Asticcacaulis aquaticus]